MGITDKITGRAKKAAGDVTGSEDTRRQGAQEEKKSDVKDEAAREQESADQKSREASRLESQT
jgi:uncharacterized protein YjbJ (UPF0337 family)